MKALLISLTALVLFSCDPIKRHQRIVRKHPEVLNLISTPKTDTVQVTITKQVECPDGTVVTVNCDTVVIYKTNTIQLPPTNAQIRQQERTKRNFEDNLRRMYNDSLKHTEKLFKLENRRLKDENKRLKKEAKEKTKQVKHENKRNLWPWILLGFITLVFGVDKYFRNYN